MVEVCFNYVVNLRALAGTATDLATAFNFKFTSGFAIDTLSQGPAIFKLSDGTLTESSNTKERSETERVDQIASFTGQGFQIRLDDRFESVIQLIHFATRLSDFALRPGWIDNSP